MSSSLETGYLLIKISGSIADLEEMKLLTRQIYDEVMKYGSKKVVVDQTENQPLDSLVSQIELVEFYSEEFPTEIRHLKIAIVTDSKNKRIAGFWETYAFNRGYPFQVFYSMDDALEFISGRSSSLCLRSRA
jgi:hypothetical protein